MYVCIDRWIKFNQDVCFCKMIRATCSHQWQYVMERILQTSISIAYSICRNNKDMSRIYHACTFSAITSAVLSVKIDIYNSRSRGRQQVVIRNMNTCVPSAITSCTEGSRTQQIHSIFYHGKQMAPCFLRQRGRIYGLTV